MAYIKNLAKSFVYAVPTVIANKFEGLNALVTSFSSDNREGFVNEFSEVKDLFSKEMDYWGGKLKTDFKKLKSGKIIDPNTHAEIDLKDFGGDDSGFDFGDDFEDDFGDDEDSESSNDDSAPISKDTQASIVTNAVNTNTMVNATTSSAEMISRTTASSAIGVSKSIIQTSSANIDALKLVSDSVSSGFQNLSVTNARMFQIHSDMLDALKDIKSNISDMAKAHKAKELRYDDKIYRDDIFGADGSLDIARYGKFLAGNILKSKEYLGMFKMMISSPLEEAFNSSIGKIFDVKFFDKLKEFSDTMKMIPMAIGEKLSNFFNKSDNFFMKAIGDFFIPKEKSHAHRLKEYDKGPVPFDGITKKAIVDVIPTLLSKIYNSIKHLKKGKDGEELIYDYDSNGFTNRNLIKKDIKRATKVNIGEFDDIREKLLTNNPNLKNKDIRNLITELVKNNKFYHYQKDDLSKLNGSSDLDAIFSQMSVNQKANFNKRIKDSARDQKNAESYLYERGHVKNYFNTDIDTVKQREKDILKEEKRKKKADKEFRDKFTSIFKGDKSKVSGEAFKPEEMNDGIMSKGILNAPTMLFNKILYTVSDKVGKFFFGGGEPGKLSLNLGAKFKSVSDYLFDKDKGMFSKLYKSFQEKVLEPVKGWFKDIGKKINERVLVPLKEWSKNIGKKIDEKIFKPFKSYMVKTWNKLNDNLLKPFALKAKDLYTKGKDVFIEKVIKPLDNFFNNPHNGLMVKMKNMYTEASAKIKNFLFNEQTGVAKKAGDWFKNKIFSLKEGSYFKGVTDFVDRTMYTPLKNTVKQTMESVKTFFRDEVVKPLKDQVFSPFFKDFKYRAQDIGKAIGDKMKDAMVAGSKYFNKATEAVLGQSLSKILEEKVVNPIKDTLGKMKDRIGKSIKSGVNATTDFLKRKSDDTKVKHLLHPDGRGGYINEDAVQNFLDQGRISQEDYDRYLGDRKVHLDDKAKADKAQAERIAKKKAEKEARLQRQFGTQNPIGSDTVKDVNVSASQLDTTAKKAEVKSASLLGKIYDWLKTTAAKAKASVGKIGKGTGKGNNTQVSPGSSAFSSPIGGVSTSGSSNPFGSGAHVVPRINTNNQHTASSSGSTNSTHATVSNISSTAQQTATTGTVDMIYLFLRRNLSHVGKNVEAILRLLGGQSAVVSGGRVKGMGGGIFSLLLSPFKLIKFIGSMAGSVFKNALSLAKDMLMMPIKLVSGALKGIGKAIGSISAAIGQMAVGFGKVVKDFMIAAGHFAKQFLKVASTVLGSITRGLYTLFEKTVKKTFWLLGKITNKLILGIGKFANLMTTKVIPGMIKFGQVLWQTTIGLAKFAVKVLSVPAKGIGKILGITLGKFKRKPSMSGSITRVYVEGGWLDGIGRRSGVNGVPNTPSGTTTPTSPAQNSPITAQPTNPVASVTTAVGQSNTPATGNTPAKQSMLGRIGSMGKSAQTIFAQKAQAAKDWFDRNFKLSVMKSSGQTAGNTGILSTGFQKLGTILLGAFSLILPVMKQLGTFLGLKKLGGLAKGVFKKGGGLAKKVGKGVGKTAGKVGGSTLSRLGKLGKFSKGMVGVGAIFSGIEAFGNYQKVSELQDNGEIDDQEAQRKKAKAVGGGIGSMAGGAVGAAIGSFLGPVGTIAGGYLGSVVGEKVFGAVAEAGTGMFQNIGKAVTNTIGGISTTFGWVGGKFMRGVDIVVGGAKDAWDYVVSIFSSIGRLISDGWNSVVGMFKSVTSAAGSWLLRKVGADKAADKFEKFMADDSPDSSIINKLSDMAYNGIANMTDTGEGSLGSALKMSKGKGIVDSFGIGFDVGRGNKITLNTSDVAKVSEAASQGSKAHKTIDVTDDIKKEVEKEKKTEATSSVEDSSTTTIPSNITGSSTDGVKDAGSRSGFFSNIGSSIKSGAQALFNSQSGQQADGFFNKVSAEIGQAKSALIGTFKSNKPLSNTQSEQLKANTINHFLSKGYTPQQVAMIMGQLDVESSGFRYLTELGDYNYFSKYNSNTKKGRDLGNTQPDDGFRFRGRGIIQLTGRANYSKAAKALGIDLIGNPDLASDPSVAIKIADWYLADRKGSVNALQRNDFSALTSSINGGQTHAKERLERYQNYLKSPLLKGANAETKSSPSPVTAVTPVTNDAKVTSPSNSSAAIEKATVQASSSASVQPVTQAIERSTNAIVQSTNQSSEMKVLGMDLNNKLLGQISNSINEILKLMNEEEIDNKKLATENTKINEDEENPILDGLEKMKKNFMSMLKPSGQKEEILDRSNGIVSKNAMAVASS